MPLDSGPGSYVLVVGVASPIRLAVGRLGVLALGPGNYLYVGSALAGLRRRILRHLRRGRPYWHIDYLLRVADVRELWTIGSARRVECDVARLLAGLVRMVAAGFGASDCRCTSHLFHVEGSEQLRSVLDALRIAYPVQVIRSKEIRTIAALGQ